MTLARKTLVTSSWSGATIAGRLPRGLRPALRKQRSAGRLEFRINTYNRSVKRAVGGGRRGRQNFVVVWHSQFQDGSYLAIR
jgi:hypothetical protein